MSTPRRSLVVTALPLALQQGTVFAETLEQGAGSSVVTNVAPAVIVIGIAGLLALTLLCRHAVMKLAHVLPRFLHQRRINSILHGHSRSVLSDFLLTNPYGGLSRIDYALCVGGGVVCIRSKRLSGSIIGDLDDPQWTLESGSKRRRFLNPVVQNEGRAEALRKLVQGLPVLNLVVLDGDVTFDRSTAHEIIAVDDLDEFLRNVKFEPCGIDDWDAAWLTITSAALTDVDSRKDFAAQLSFG